MRSDFLAEHFHREPVRPGVHTPIDEPEVIARLVFAIILEIDGAPRAPSELGARETGHGVLRRLHRVAEAEFFSGLQRVFQFRAHAFKLKALCVGDIDGRRGCDRRKRD
jgi:hypothetical protein